MNVTAVILAGSAGERMYPLCGTDDDSMFDEKASASANQNTPATPKCLLPLAGSCPLALLIAAVKTAGLPNANIKVLAAPEIYPQISGYVQSSGTSNIEVTKLTVECAGSADALRQVKREKNIDESHSILLLSSDLVLENASCLVGLVESHHSVSNSSKDSVSLLLADFGHEDGEGVPVKESKKSKLGFLAREEEDIEFVGLAVKGGVNTSGGLCVVSDPVKRVLLKISRAEVDETEENVGETPKLEISKELVRAACQYHQSSLSLRTDLVDLHAYLISPWVWSNLINCQSYETLQSIQNDILPLLIKQQLSGFDTETSESCGITTAEFCVAAHVLPRSAVLALRVCTVPNYLHACKEAVTHSIRPPALHPSSLPSTFGRLEGTVHAKDNALFLEGAEKGSGGACKNSTVGKNSKIGSKCKINNCMIMDNVTIANGVTLQNSIISSGVTIEDGCNLNDCQVAPNLLVAAKTKVNGETLE